MSNSLKVMVVDDSITIRYEIRLILKKLGIVPVEVVNELGMFMKIDEYGRKPDLIIMDITLQYENGLELVKKLKSVDEYKDIPVLMLTEHAEKENVMKAKELGVTGYVRKPIQAEDFIKRVSEILGI